LGATNPQPTKRRKGVTVLNDDGRVAWGELSGKEKVARTTQQTFNFSMIILGAVLTVRIPGASFLDQAHYI
jgi:import inner membrane translocase subunit TIM21